MLKDSLRILDHQIILIETMANNKKTLAKCDQCSFTYPRKTMKMNSYGMLMCYSCYDGSYDLKNHPQNSLPRNIKDLEFIKNPRAPDNSDRNKTWGKVNTQWQALNKTWNTV